jgi:hypothetical protein
MPRPKNALGTVQERFSGNRIIRAYLEDLVKTGLYGRSRGEVAERMVSQGIERLIKRGTITRRTPDRSTD